MAAANWAVPPIRMICEAFKSASASAARSPRPERWVTRTLPPSAPASGAAMPTSGADQPLASTTGPPRATPARSMPKAAVSTRVVAAEAAR